MGGTGDGKGDEAPCLRVNGLRSHRRRGRGRGGGFGVSVGSAGDATSVKGAVARVSLRPLGSASVVAFRLGSVCLSGVPVLVGSADTG